MSLKMQGSARREARTDPARRSYGKTVRLAVVFTGILAMLAASVLLTGSSIGWFAWVILAVGMAVGLVVSASGILVVYRHDAEMRGEPDLFWRLGQPIADTRSRRLMRRLRRLAGSKRLYAGDIVRVREIDEIMRSLDKRGMNDGVPFTPEMVPFCGQTFRVFRRVDKIHDWIGTTGLRRMPDVVTLDDVRCDGSSHGGCQAECHLLWHTQWLERCRETPEASRSVPFRALNEQQNEWLLKRTRREVPDGEDSTDPRYICQITELLRCSTPMRWWDPRLDLVPLLCGNVGLRAFLVATLTRVFNRIQQLRGGSAYPVMPAQLTRGPTPTEDLSLNAGDRVIIKDKSEIGQTLFRNHNRGLWFGAETMRFCGQPATVRSRVQRIINETDGSLINFSTPTIILEEVMATGEFLHFCPQNEYVYWREIWLRKEPEEGATVD